MSMILRCYNRRHDLDDALAIEEFRHTDLTYRIESAIYEARCILGMPHGDAPEKPILSRAVSNYEGRGQCMELIKLCRDMIWIWEDGCGYPRYDG